MLTHLMLKYSSSVWTTMKLVALLLCFVAPSMARTPLCNATCEGEEDECVFHVSVALTEGQLGYFVFEECPLLVSPTLAMEVGVTYKFVQSNVFTYFHPLGFAYFADGAHDEKDELEPGIAPPGTNSSCAETLSCDAPMYFVNGTYFGTYSNIPEILEVTQGEDNFGLDDYEPRFFWPFTEWLEQGEEEERFSVALKFTNEDIAQDIFYFCHIHQYMTGRIKLLKNGSHVSPDDFPEIPYEYDAPGDYDKECGTMGLEEFQLPHPECPDRFVCGQASDSKMVTFGGCIDSMNCRLIADVTTGVSAESEIALFLHQMIPHHENAVNMAKALLQTGELDACSDYLSEDPECLMFDIAISIVNDQNHQIQLMRALLENMGYPEIDDCTVTIESSL